MAQIIAICKEHQIPMFASFELGEPGEEDPTFCTTALLPDEWRPHKKLIRVYDVLVPPRPVSLMETVTTNPDGHQTVSIRRV